MTSYIVTTKIKGDFATLAADGSSFGTSGPMSMDSIRREPEKENPRFSVRGVTMSAGGFATHFDKSPAVEVADSANGRHKEDFVAKLGAAAKAKK